MPNAKFVLAAAESLPLELSGVATEVTVPEPSVAALLAAAALAAALRRRH